MASSDLKTWIEQTTDLVQEDMSPSVYLALMFTSNFILVFILSASLQQFCNVEVARTQRKIQTLRRTSMPCIFCVLALALNSLVYLSSIYEELDIATNICDGVTIIVGFHIFKICIISTIQQMHGLIGMESSNVFKHLLLFLEISNVFSVIVCYSLVYILNDSSWISMLYIALAIIILIESIAVHVALQKIINNGDKIHQNLMSRWIKVTKKLVLSIYVSVFIDMVCVLVVIINLDYLLNWKHMKFNQLLLYDLLHTLVLITMSIVLFGWRFRGFKCSTNPNSFYRKCLCRGGNEENIQLIEDNTLSGMNPTLNTTAFSHNCESLKGK